MTAHEITMMQPGEAFRICDDVKNCVIYDAGAGDASLYLNSSKYETPVQLATRVLIYLDCSTVRETYTFLYGERKIVTSCHTIQYLSRIGE
jgi:hypothetical protein